MIDVVLMLRLARQNDLFIFLGDNIYADTRDIAVMKAKYAKLAAQPGFRRLRETTPLVVMEVKGMVCCGLGRVIERVRPTRPTMLSVMS